MAVKSGKLRSVSRKKQSGAKRRPARKHTLSRAFLAERDYFDYNLLATVILLTCFGLVMLYSTSAYESMLETGGDDMSYFRRQAIVSAGAMVLALVGSQFDYHFLARFSAPLYWVSVALLIATRFIGREVNGARRWIYFGPVSFQSAELAKLAIILFIPVLIVKMGKQMRGIKAPAIVFGFGMIPSFCAYVFTQNLSTALIIAGITAVLIFIAHPKTLPFVAAVGVGTVLVTILVAVLAGMQDETGSFRIQRIQVWLDPESYASLGGYQVMQALYAIGSGGFFGKGLGKSAQKLGSLPEAQNDMIFSIICEELGVFGAALLILLFVFLLYRLFFIAQNAPDLLGALIASGIFIHIAIQVVLNIAVVINLIPTTGITLPFVSYGGTSSLFLMGEIALALSVSRQIKFKS